MADYQIFISYRRDGGEDLAGRIDDKLTARGYEVFFDVESMRSGEFNKQILGAIDQCSDVVLVLPQGALDRCVSADDWVRQEIEHALKGGKNIIPVMMRGFTFPDTLPESIDKIRYYEGVTASNEYFSAVIDKIVGLLTCDEKGAGPSLCIEEVEKYLKFKMFDKVCDMCNEAIGANFENAEAHFYSAVALMKGKRPFLTPKATIEEIEEKIKVAIMLQPMGIYYFFLAYIRFDFYAKKFLKVSPDWKELYNKALEYDVAESEIASLSSIFGVERIEFR